ncbi:MAG: SUMF1/EgtB/PvdO family nonheme iron enzyme [Alphaproteobacteria bacterium]
MKYDLFISHSSADAAAARTLVDEIESHGVLKCWIAPRDIPIGAAYTREIVRAIASCGGFVLLFSAKTNESDHVLREIELAEQGKKPIYPIKIDGSEPAEGIKYFLASKQWVERKALGNRLVETIEQMVASAQGVGGGIGAGIERPPAPPAPPRKPRISPMLIGAAAIVLLLLGGGVAAWKSDVFGYHAAAEKERVRLDEQATLVEQQRREAQAKIEAQKRLADQAELERLRKEEDERKKREEEAKRAEAEKEKQRVASLQSSSLPVGASSDITIEKSAPTVETAVPGKTFFRECDICPVMAVVAAGSNVIGSPAHENGRSVSEGPQQPVAFRLPLAVGRSEIAFEEYIACINEGGCPAGVPTDYDWGYGRQPAMNISWNDAKAYVAWLSRKTRATYRLLSEAEWEYAARGCAKVCESLPFWFGIEISKDKVNYDSRIAYLGSVKATRRERTVPIDAVSQPNPFGLLHVHGNVAEWVEDCWEESLAGMSRDGAARTTGDCSRRVVKGGSYDDPPKDVRSAKRTWQAAGDRRAQVGFRVARELKL